MLMIRQVARAFAQRARAATLALAVSMLAVPAAFAGDVFVIANTGTTLTAAEVREVWLGEKQFAGSQKLTPVDNGAAQDDFLAKVMKMDAAKYASSWTKKSFRDGLNAPAVKGSDAETVEFVKRTPGGVGYVTTSPAGVTVVGKF